MAVPNWKWLIYPERWNVADVLRRAGIGEYVIYEQEEMATFSVSSQLDGVEARAVKPRRMPSEIVNGDYDCGITGKDCFQNANIESLDELIDLKCSYVDLAFMTDSARWKGVEEKKEGIVEKLNLPSLSDLDLFLIHYGMSNQKIICESEYHNTAGIFLSEKQQELSQYTKFQYSVKESRGDTEECLFCEGDDKANIIFELMATGEHSSEKRLEVLEIADNSTARLYSKSCLKNPANEEDKGKKEKIREIQRRIGQVLRDIESLVQIRFTFDLRSKKDFLDGFDKFFFGGFEEKTIYGESVHLTNQPVIVDKIISYKKLERLIRKDKNHRKSDEAGHLLWDKLLKNREDRANSLMQNPLIREIEPALKYFNIRLKKIDFYRLKELYSYCPVFRSGEIEKDRYPCADVTKLRPEHYEKAIVDRI